MKLKLLPLIFSLAAFTSCDELLNEDTTSPDGSLPYISMLAPYENSVFTSSQSVRIKSEISDKDKIKRLEVHVSKSDGTGGDVWGYTKFPKKHPVIIDTTFSAAGLATGDYIITLNTIDGRTNVGSKVIRFSIK
jgi:hypothetical protein